MKKIKNKMYLNDLEIEIVKGNKGFVVWTTERKKIRNKIVKIRHWVIDASYLKEDGIINLGSKNLYKIEGVINNQDNTVEIVKLK